jgi:SAM-dependent methyltransferase
MAAISRVRGFVRYTGSILREQGPVATAEFLGERAQAKLCEWRLGIRTTGYIPSCELTDDEQCIGYQPISYGCLDSAFRYVRPTRGDVFLDYGCGKGRAVVVAARHPFRRVIGVEQSEALSTLARENIAHARRKLRCPEVAVVTSDATQFVVPPAVNVVLFFNPFVGEVLAQVQARLRSSLEESPRALTILYLYPTDRADEFAPCDWLRADSDLPTGLWRDVRFVAYRSR